ncbi:GNAT family N-acetyltransferase [Nocardioides lianchengensis]|uniref:Predicted acetyltransferase, GNAT family n=1 Tax=Nocardioides lianchengensis TaxID=1045774 RepID=A0A1G6NXH3_9ACTN|nr:GNAT family N-acetyltransferase [Nocardioides lianchengensis]NYG10923.1 RimJ/RimL family protein N-acetyltransferase [Nocardioides lianchengensis]SDC72448.1 Predicted acetyltransferase, GNAT family [Nocardioides lianchengensis]
MTRLELTTDPSAFLALSGEHLAADPVLTTVVASVTARAVDEDARGVLPGAHPRWWVSVLGDDGRVVGVAMRTAPFAPFPAFLLPMPDEAAVALARELHARGEVLGGVNGALRPAQLLAEETARLGGGTVVVEERTRLWELGDLVAHDAPGRLRVAVETDVPLATAWWNDFGELAAEMAGRSSPHASETLTEGEMAPRVAAGQIWLWEDPDGTVVHLTHHNAPAYGVVRVGPVITPREHRRRGYASAAVAQVSARILAAGHRACLFTDQANPTSNKIYAEVGYRPVVDMANLVIS